MWVLFGLVGYDCELFIRATQGEIGRTFSSNHLLYIPPVNHYNKDPPRSAAPRKRMGDDLQGFSASISDAQRSVLNQAETKGNTAVGKDLFRQPEAGALYAVDQYQSSR